MGLLDDIKATEAALLKQWREPYPTGLEALPPMSPAAADQLRAVLDELAPRDTATDGGRP